MNAQFSVISAPLVNVRVTSNLSDFTAEKRFDRGLAIGDLRGRLELVTGASSGNMTLQVFDLNDQFVCNLDADNRVLGSYCVEENYRIHVTDPCQSVGEFEDVSRVEKFNLSEEEYAKKADSVRNFLLKNNLGKYNEEEQARIAADREAGEKSEEIAAAAYKIGDRCEVKVQGEPTRRGEIMYIGDVHFKPGVWVGVKYDEPLGKNDGSIGGRRYFTAGMKYGGFTRPSNVEIGQFPAISDEEDDEM